MEFASMQRVRFARDAQHRPRRERDKSGIASGAHVAVGAPYTQNNRVRLLPLFIKIQRLILRVEMTEVEIKRPSSCTW